MSRRIHRLSITFAMALLSTVVASAAFAQDTETGATFEIFGGRVEPTDSDADIRTESYGIRGGYRRGSVLAVEGTAARLNEDVDVWFGDLSIKGYFVHANRFEMYALGGPGVFKAEDEGEELTVHAGIGAEIGLGARAYLRPEVRGRWLAEELKADEGLAEYSLGIGWRF